MMNFETKDAVAEWAMDHTMAELALAYSELTGNVATFENREDYIEAIWRGTNGPRPKGKGKRFKGTTVAQAMAASAQPQVDVYGGEDEAPLGNPQGLVVNGAHIDSPLAVAKPAATEKPAATKARRARVAPVAKVAARKATKGRAKAKKTTARKPPASEPREGSKTAIIIGLVSRKSGASLAELMRAAKWQAHSVRGFMSTLGKTMTVESGGGKGKDRVYRAR